MSKSLIHSIILIVAIGITFLFPKTTLAQYDLQIVAILFIVLFIAKRYLIPKEEPSRLMESVIFTMVIIGIVNTTGGTESPFFFLIYFLLFSISLLLEPIISITATIALVVFFLMGLPENQSLKTLLPIFSLAFLTPFAMFMGQEYVESQKLEEDSLLFLSLMLKNHIKSIKDAVENFMGDKELHDIKRSTHRMEKIIEEYEKSTN